MVTPSHILKTLGANASRLYKPKRNEVGVIVVAVMLLVVEVALMTVVAVVVVVVKVVKVKMASVTVAAVVVVVVKVASMTVAVVVAGEGGGGGNMEKRCIRHSLASTAVLADCRLPDHCRLAQHR